MDRNINSQLVSRCVGFHGPPLQKIWEGERGEKDLQKLGIANPDFTAYKSRQKYFSFQDRAKRLKLHQFIAKKASVLFNNGSNIINEYFLSTESKETEKDVCAALPPYEHFLSERIDKSLRLKHILSLLKPGDIIYGSVYSKTVSGMIVKLLCTGSSTIRLFGELNAKAYLPTTETIPAIDKKGNSRSYLNHDIVCCEIIDIIVDSEKIIIGMKGNHRHPDVQFDEKVQFGLISSENLPELYKLSIDRRQSYEFILENSEGFSNPNSIEFLANEVGLIAADYYTNMNGLRDKFPIQEYGSELRQVQASKWAFRSVAEGIEHFKDGRHSEAFQCLNKALSIDPRNVEGLVARGALYANSGSFKKAVDDFDTALKLNPNHANARKYMGETLVALGRSYEEEQNIDEAKKAYQNCLEILPHHEEAKNSLDFLWTKSNFASNAKQLIEPNELTLPAYKLKITEHKRENAIINKEKRSKKKKSKNRKRSTTSSSTDNTDSSDTSSQSTSSSESSSSSDSIRSKNMKKKKRLEKTKQKSLSPLSKRMAFMHGNRGAPDDMHSKLCNQIYPPVAQKEQSGPIDEYELRVRKFLELTRDEENYEDKVRKFVEEAEKYRKDRKFGDEKAKKRDKKKSSRKAKKDIKKKRKDKKSKSIKKEKDELAALENMEFREALKIFKSLPVFDLNTKLTADTEKNIKHLKEESKKTDDMDKDENKWKMIFSKDDRKNTGSAIPTSKQMTTTYSFSKNDDPSVGFGSFSHYETTEKATKKSPEKKERKRPFTPPISEMKPILMEQPAIKPPIGQVVLDKFGNFRLASNDKPLDRDISSRRSKSRSRSHRKYSSESRSRSRSNKRRFRSRSFDRRRSNSRAYRSRSPSRRISYSRSRSRSGSIDRRRNRYRGRGGYDRGTYYKPRFGSARYSGRGNRGGYRELREYRGRGRDNWYRGNWNNRGGGANRHRRDNSRDRRVNLRSRSKSYHSDEQKSSPKPNKKSPHTSTATTKKWKTNENADKINNTEMAFDSTNSKEE